MSADFVAHMEDVLDLYAEPYDPQRPVVCFDESSTQLLADVREPLPAKPGKPKRVDYEYRREGTRNLFMTCEPLAVVAVINLASPAVEPCLADSPPIIHHGQLFTLLDLMVDECVSVVGEAASREDGQIVVVVDRGDYLQPVGVIGPPEVLEQVTVGGQVRVAGRIRKHEDWGYAVHHGVDRGWWGNLRENFPGDFLAP